MPKNLPEPPAGKPARPRIGLVGLDEMRTLGLAGLLGDGAAVDLLPLTAPGALHTPGLSLALIDAEAVAPIFEVLAAFRNECPSLRLLVLGAEVDLAYITRVIGAGAKGYLSYRCSEEELTLALRVVQDGSIWAPRKVLANLLEGAQDAQRLAEPTEVRFTRREREVLQLLALAHPNREIAAQLGVDEGTVKAHLGRLMRKAGVDNRTALSMRAIARGWTKGA